MNQHACLTTYQELFAEVKLSPCLTHLITVPRRCIWGKGLTQRILNLGTRWRWAVTVTTQWYPLGGPQDRLGRCAEDKNSCPCRESNPVYSESHPGYTVTTRTHCRTMETPILTTFTTYWAAARRWIWGSHGGTTLWDVTSRSIVEVHGPFVGIYCLLCESCWACSSTLAMRQHVPLKRP
jgi:hypothetical protein